MATVIKHSGRVYRPLLKRNGKMDMRTGVSYGAAGQYLFILTVYVKCCMKGAKESTELFFDIPAMREMVDQATPMADQLQQLDFMCNVVAAQCNADYKLRQPHNPRPRPVGYREPGNRPSKTWNAVRR